MAQKRYFDYQSKLRSKTSAEAMALASAGIGVKYGFNKVSVSGNTFVLSSDGTITLTNNETGALDEVKHVVITPDGIISAETDDISLVLQDSQSIEDNTYYFVLASHRHIESLDAIMATSYTVVKSNDDLSQLLGTDKTIKDWYDSLLNSYPEFNRDISVILAIIEYKNSKTINTYVPLNNKWPNEIELINSLDKKVNDSYSELLKQITNHVSSVNNSISELNTKINNLKIKSFTASFGSPSGSSRDINIDGYTLNSNTRIIILAVELIVDKADFNNIPCIKNILLSTVYTPFENDGNDWDDTPYIVGCVFDSVLNFSGYSKLEGNTIKCSISSNGSSSFNSILRGYAIETI